MTTTAPTPETGCGRCDSRWNGHRTVHCGECHTTFTALATFDKHRTGSHAEGTRACLPPADAGLVQTSRTYPCWSQPGDDDWEFGDPT